MDPRLARALTPAQIVAALDRHVVGQRAAKRAVAIALRERTRRRALEPDLAKETTPRNILMIGPTGVGKTEIARRMADLSDAPFVKVEATRFTEVGYVGRDVEHIIRDLALNARERARERHARENRAEAQRAAEARLLDALVGANAPAEARRAMALRLRAGEEEAREVSLALAPTAAPTSAGLDPMRADIMDQMRDMMARTQGGQAPKPARPMAVAAAREALEREETDARIDEDALAQEAIHDASNNGVVFLDEVDKICAPKDGRGSRGEVSREGVQRDLLPLLEGARVTTRWGVVDTSHVLFIASGAFQGSRPADLMPEFQGRLPVRVEMESLDEAALRRILTEPEASLTRQAIGLLATEGVRLVFAEDGLDALAHAAAKANAAIENVGARRLHTLLARTLEDISFAAPDLAGEEALIDAAWVETRLASAMEALDLDRFIL